MWEILKQGFKGLRNQGSSRRLTAFYFTSVLITMLDITYITIGIKTKSFPADFVTVLTIHVTFVAAVFTATTTENIKANKTDKP